MFRLKTQDPREATGAVADTYALFPPQIGVPGPLIMMSASPELVGRQAEFFKYFRAHPRLSFKLQALLRYLMAAEAGYGFCVGFNGNMLKMTGLSDVDLEAVQDDPSLAPLAENEKALLSFVVKALRQPDQVSDDQVRALRDLGWADPDIFDAMWIGANMLGMARLFNALARPQANPSC